MKLQTSKYGFQPPGWYTGSFAASISHHRPGILASVLPIGFVLTLIVVTERMSRFPTSGDPFFLNFVCFGLMGALTAWPTYLIIRRLPDYMIDGFSILIMAVLFPLWGAVGVVAGLFILAPFSCTAIWAINLAIALGKRRARHFFYIQSVATLALGTACVFVCSQLLVYDQVIFPILLAWHLAYPFALALTTELRHRDLEYLRSVCHTCGYPREGLTPDAPCPECGLA